MKTTPCKYQIPSNPGEHKLQLPKMFRNPHVYKDSKGNVFLVAETVEGSPLIEHVIWIFGVAEVHRGTRGRCVGSFSRGEALFFVYRKCPGRSRYKKEVVNAAWQR